MTKLQRYLRHGHRAVDGWLEPAAIEVIPLLMQRQLECGIFGSACEIGVHHGRLLILLHLLTAGRTVGWDLFECQEENVDKSGRGNLARALENFERHGDPERVRLVQRNSLALTPESVALECGVQPCVFSVDGGHTAQITAHDLHTAAGSICPGGLVILDDCFNEAWPGVAEGAIPCLISGLLIPVVIAGNKVICTNRKDIAAEYRREFGLSQSLYWERNVEFCGCQVRVVHTWKAGWRRVLVESLRRAINEARRHFESA